MHTFRTLGDVDEIIEGAGRSAQAVVVGGGLLGLEAAYGLRLRGVDVCVVHLMDRLMERQLDRAGARVLRGELSRWGCGWSCPPRPPHPRQRPGRGDRAPRRPVLDADLVVIACGIRPATGLARDCGLEVGRGILVDDALRTSDPEVLAIGECTEHRGILYGIVAPLRTQARVLAARLRGDETAALRRRRPRDHPQGRRGPRLQRRRVEADTDDDLLTLEDTASRVYKRVLLREAAAARRDPGRRPQHRARRSPR